MYDELIEQLRSRASWLEFAIIAKPSKTDGNGDAILFRKAADAIEDLQVSVDGLTAQTSMVFEKTEGRTVIKFEPKWIPVTERLPESVRKSYLCLTDTGYHCEARWTNNVYGLLTSSMNNKWGWSIADVPQFCKITHWMPLPEPPEEG